MGSLGYVMQVPEEEKYLMSKDEILTRIVSLFGAKRPGRRSALSNTSGLLVAPSITSPFELSKPSISDNNYGVPYRTCGFPP